MRRGDIDSRIVRIGPRICKLWLFEATRVPIGLTPVLSASKYVKCVSGQPSALDVILNQGTPQ